MKIVFLDFDGVLNTLTSIQVAGESYFDNPCNPAHVAHLNDLLARSGAKVVVSSSWRIGRSLSDLRELLLRGGFKGEVIGKTDRDGGGRGMECVRWLLDFDPHRQRVESFCALEDVFDMAPIEHQTVRVDPEQGLKVEDVERAVMLLERSGTRWP